MKGFDWIFIFREKLLSEIDENQHFGHIQTIILDHHVSTIKKRQNRLHLNASIFC